MEQDEYTFLCGYQKIRRYGSTSDLNSPSSCGAPARYTRLIVHRVEPSDTLQSLELKYNSSMYEIKRLNRLWSNNSLHCKMFVHVPVFGDGGGDKPPTSLDSSCCTSSADSFRPQSCVSSPDTGDTITITPAVTNGAENCAPSGALPQRINRRVLEKVDEMDCETLDQIFKRIDRNVKKTQKVVKKLNKRKSDSVNVDRQLFF